MGTARSGTARRRRDGTFPATPNSEFDALYEELTFASSAARDALEREMEDMVLTGCAALPIAFAAKNQACSGAWLGLRADHGAGLFFTPAILRQQLQGMTNGR